MAKRNSGWNFDDSLEDTLGSVQQDRSGARYVRKTSMTDDFGNGPGAIGFGEDERAGRLLGRPKNPSTPGTNSAAEAMCPKQPSRGNVGFSADDFGILGKPQAPGKA